MISGREERLNSERERNRKYALLNWTFILWKLNFLINYFTKLILRNFRERREAEQRERERQEKERMEKERLQREHRERQERERQERERQREKQLSAVEAVDHHFQLSMELAKKVSPSPQIFRYYYQKRFQGFFLLHPPD